jgi:hypothetical protein
VKSDALRLLRSPFTLWVAFVLTHTWLGLVNLYADGYPLGDVTFVYRFWVDQFVVNGFRVGIDSQWVYPILAFPPMLAAFAFGAAAYASTWLSIVLLLDIVAFGVLTNWGRNRSNDRAAWWWIAFLLLLGPIALGRIDSISIPLAMIGVLLLTRRPRAAALLLTLATWVKVWPAAVIAAIVIAVRDRRHVLAVVAAVSAAIVVVVLVLGGGTNVFSFVTQQTGRGLQIEAPISTIWLWMAASGVPGAYVYYDRAILTFQIDGPGSAAAAALTSPLLAIAALAVCALGILAMRRGASTMALLPSLSLALVTALIVFNKVGSPQYETWLAVPVVLGIIAARAGGRSFRTPVILVLVIAALTQAIYPYLYDYLLRLHPIMLIAITTRNLLLIVLFGWALAGVIRLARSEPSADEPNEDEPAVAEATPWPLRANS